MKRRALPKALVASILSFSLIETLVSKQVFPKSIEPIAKHWLTQLNEYCADLKKQAMSPVEWQNYIAKLYKQVELSELLQLIDFENLTKRFEYRDLGVNTKAVKFPNLGGIPKDTVFVKKIFGMKKDRAIIPHGHSNMVSSHLVIKGEMHLQQYEKFRREDDHLIIRPTIDKNCIIGESSSISDEQNNIHWFIANSETAFTFDVIVLDLKEKPYDIHNIDIYEKQDLSDGKIRVPLLDVDTALKKYGKNTHH